MADTGALPALFGRLNGRRAPGVAIVVTAAVAAVFVILGDLALVASVTDFSVYVVFIAVNLTVILLRLWQPKRRRPFRIRGTIGKVPITPVLALAAVGLLLPSLEASALVLGTAVLVAGVAVYALIKRLSPQPPTPALLPEDEMTPRTKISVAEAAKVADILRIDFEVVGFDLAQFHIGMTTELQHGTGDPDTNVTNDDLVATGKLALAHLNEIADYYTRLAAMEAEARDES